MATDTSELPAAIKAWADDIAGLGGEEYEHTLYFDERDIDQRWVQVWDDTAETDEVPWVGVCARFDESEFRADLTPDQALELAAMLITHADHARKMALEVAGDEWDAARASAITGSSEDYSYLDPDEGQDD